MSLCRVAGFTDKYFFSMVIAAVILGATFSGSLGVYTFSVSWVFGLLTFITALGTGAQALKRAILSPGKVILAIALLHILFPALSLLLGKAAFQNNPEFITGLILLSAVPSGISSAILVGMSGGNISLTITVVTLDVVLSPLAVPGIIRLFGGRVIEFDSLKMMADLVKMIVIPSVIGILLHDLSRGKIVSKITPWDKLLSKFLLCWVIMVNSAASWPKFVEHSGEAVYWMLTVVFIQTVMFFLISKALCDNVVKKREDAIALTYVSAMRNISAGIVIGMAYFGPTVSLPVVVASLFQQPMASVMHNYLIRKPFSLRRENQNQYLAR